MRRLRELELYDRSVVVVTSDHGFSFRPGSKRRRLSLNNRHDILSIPLIVKAPFQTEGIVDVRSFELVDLLPTIAPRMALEVPWDMEGKNVHDPATPRRRATVAFATYAGAGWKKIVTKPWRYRRRGQSLLRKVELFGTGAQSLWPAPPEGFEELIGLEAGSVPMELPAEVELESPLPKAAFDLEPRFRTAPLRLSGTVANSSGDGPFHLALAVNGVIHAVTRVGTDGQPREGAFWAFLLQEDAYRAGPNSAELYVVERRDSGFVMKGVEVSFAES